MNEHNQLLTRFPHIVVPRFPLPCFTRLSMGSARIFAVWRQRGAEPRAWGQKEGICPWQLSGDLWGHLGAGLWPPKVGVRTKVLRT